MRRAPAIATSLWVVLALVGGFRAGDALAEAPGGDPPAFERSEDARREFRERYLNARPEQRQRMRREVRRRWREADPAQRAEFRSRHRERWEALPDDQRRRFRRAVERRRMRFMHRQSPRHGGLGPEFQRLSEAERARLRERVRALPPEERRELMSRIRDFRTLSAAEQEEMRARLNALHSATPEERERLRSNADRWQAMKPEERARLREQLERLRELPEEERQLLLEELVPGADSR